MQLDRLKLSRIVLLIAGIGLVLAMIFAVANIREDLVRASAARDSARMVDLSVALSDLLHDQQRERGFSAVHIISGGREFGEEMRAQRDRTDAQRAALAQTIASLRSEGADPEIMAKLERLAKSVDGIDAMRGEVDGFAVTLEEVEQFYTAINREAIGVVGEVSAGVSDPAVARQMLVYTALLHGKDMAGLERHNGAAGFTIGSFGNGLAAKLVALAAGQQSYFSYVDSLAAPQHRDSLRALLDSDGARTMERLRAVAQSGDPARIARVRPAEWFDNQTAKMGDIKALEDAMAADIKAAMFATLEAANFEVLLTAVLLLAGLGLASALSLTFIRIIDRRVKSVMKPLDALARGERDVALPDLAGTEFAVLADTMAVMKRAVLDKEAADREREQVVQVLRERLSAMAGGNLNQQIDGLFAHELAPLRTDFNHAQEALRAVILSVVESSREIGLSAGEVSEAASDLSERTVRQASTLEEAAAALRRTTLGVQDSATLSQDANREVARAREAAAENGKVVQSTVSAMEQIQQSFAEVQQITAMIQNIAFQTNILALNAGVEATRAGEAGKGFAVVANEVRALAQRSSEAVTSIQQLMTRSAENIAHGSEQVTASGSALKDMIAMIDTVSRRICELASASQGHAEALGEVNAAIAELDTATQQNAAMAEQSSAASRVMSDEVRKLNDTVAIFVRHDAGRPDETGDDPVELRLSA
jgi:methyl-accepting chemotaxis protein